MEISSNKIEPMTPLQIQATDKTPRVSFDPANGIFEISGKSIPQDAETFYAPVLEWVEEYVHSSPVKTRFVLNLEYFNISSSKRILFILYKLNELVDSSKDVSVTWYYTDTDEDMKEVGHDFAFMVRVPFEFVAQKKNSAVSA